MAYWSPLKLTSLEDLLNDGSLLSMRVKALPAAKRRGLLANLINIGELGSIRGETVDTKCAFEQVGSTRSSTIHILGHTFGNRPRVPKRHRRRETLCQLRQMDYIVGLMSSAKGVYR